MSEKEQMILENISSAMQKMTPQEQKELAAFSEGLAYMAEKREEEAEEKAG